MSLLTRKIRRALLTLLKVGFLAFVGAMLLVQIPELRYDLGETVPVEIRNPEELTLDRYPGAVFVMVHGRPDFQKGFVYRRYGLNYTYFNIDPFGMRIVVRTHDEVTDEWRNLDRFLGKLRPFNAQPFHYKIRDIYQEKFSADVPEDAFFLALDDVPRLSGWQIGAVVFSGVLWLVMFYFFFFFRWKRPF
jgi:hypothetical protein